MKREVEEQLQAALQDFGYVRVKKNIFRAPWSSGVVDHFVHFRWFNWFGARQEVEVSLRVRHQEARSFSYSRLTALDPRMREVIKNLTYESFVSLDIGRLCAWSARSLLSLDYWEAERSVRMIMDGLERKARPMVAAVKNDSTMYDFLTKTFVVQKWPANYAAIALETIFLGKRLGYGEEEVMAWFASVRGYLKASLMQGTALDDFLAETWKRA